MNIEPTRATAPIRILAESERRKRREHLSPEKLTAYHEQQLPEQEQEEVREHLCVCDECTSFVLALAAADDPELMADIDLGDAKLDADYITLSTKLYAPVSKDQVTKPGTKRSHLYAWQGLAASLLVGLIAASWWGLSLQRNLRLAEAPRVNVHILDLVPLGVSDERRAVGEASIPSEVPSALIFLNVNEFTEYPAYEFEIQSLNAPEARPQVISGLSRSEEGNFTLELRQAELPEGEYEMTLLGVRDGQREVIARYAAEIVYRKRGGERPEK